MAATSTIDDLTGQAIRQAISAAAAGRIAEACAIGERALQNGGDHAALHAMLGMLRCRSGDLEGGINDLRLAHAARPRDPVIANNLAGALAQTGRYQEALDIVGEELARSDRTLQLMKLRGFLLQTLEQFELAASTYEVVVAAAPEDWESWNNLGNARSGAGDFEGAVKALRRAAAIAPDSPPVRLNLANALRSAGQLQQAEQEFRAMAEDFPDDSKALRELFTMLREQFREEEALGAIEEASRRTPDDVELALGLASHLLLLLRHGEAEDAYRRVLAIEPHNNLAYLGVATVHDLTNRTAELSAWVSEAEAAGVGPDALNFIRAFDHRRAKRFVEGLEAIRQVPEELETSRRYHLLGQLLEGVADYDAAFAAFERMNAIARDNPSQPDDRAASYRAAIRRQIQQTTPEWAASLPSAKVDPRPSPVFLVGFPRSGTTLLDTILMGHPGVEVLEEEPPLKHASDFLGSFDAIAQAPDEKLAAARDMYFDSARARTPLAPGKLLVDKNPLWMNSLPVIMRLFPEARIILALRHPCDVVLSCLVTNFKLNDAMANFLRLDTAAELYDLSFRFFEQSRQLLDPPVHSIMYENIVADRDRELRPLFDFLGLDWHDAVLDHEATARSRGHIKTASYAQVVEPIYTRSAGRWQNYRKHLEPVLPVLRPWAEKFGYEV
jgi:tetratricopeptide (TPR) repeat protein